MQQVSSALTASHSCLRRKPLTFPLLRTEGEDSDNSCKIKAALWGCDQSELQFQEGTILRSKQWNCASLSLCSQWPGPWTRAALDVNPTAGTRPQRVRKWLWRLTTERWGNQSDDASKNDALPPDSRLSLGFGNDWVLTESLLPGLVSIYVGMVDLFYPKRYGLKLPNRQTWIRRTQNDTQVLRIFQMPQGV